MSRRESLPGGRPVIDKTRQKALQIEAERNARREAMAARKIERAAEERRNVAAGNPGDIDFISLVRDWRDSGNVVREDHFHKGVSKICISVRKRPVSSKERAKKDHDSITCANPHVHVHSAKLKVDGITKYLDNNSFRFDHSFDETETTQDVYKYTTMPLVDFVCAGKGGRATCFAYGQTGSGKTYTMGGIQVMVAEDIYMLLGEGSGCRDDDTVVTVSMFELYGGRCQDLLNDRTRLKILEDGKGEVVVTGLEEYQASDPGDFLTLVDAGNRNRTTHATEANDTSSRSHAVLQIHLRDKATGRLKGKLSLVDLAGSERGSDTKSHNRQRRTESSEINKSLLALKECIRALDNGGGQQHVPYRASKLTLVLKDCFTSPLARTAMIATVSPGASACDHTLNTLRYADRVKEKKVGGISNARKAEIRVEEEAKRERQQQAARELRKQYNAGADDFDEHLPPPPVEEKKKFVSRDNIERRLDANAQKKAGGVHGNRHSQQQAAKYTEPPRSPHRNQANTAAAASEERRSPQRRSRSPQRRKQTIESKASVRDVQRPQAEVFDDVTMLHESLRSHGDSGLGAADEDAVALLHKTVDEIFEEEEQLLNLHMSTIQESAELLTSEGKLLQQVQGQDDYEIDDYAARLEVILARKMVLTSNLSKKLKKFREALRKEEMLSQRVENMPAY